MSIKNILLLLMLLISSPYFAEQGDQVIYSDSGDTKEYTLSAPDKSLIVQFSPVGGRAESLYINGSWNRLSNNIAMEDRLGQIKAFDFVLGTYTDLVTNDHRPIYSVGNQSTNSIIFNAVATIKGQKLSIQRIFTLLSNGQAHEQLILSNQSSQNLVLDFGGLAFSFNSLFDITRATTNKSNIPEYKYYNGEKLEKANIHGGSWFGGPNPIVFLQGVQWATIADNFFLAIARPLYDNTLVVYNGLEYGPQSKVNLGIQVLATNIQPAQSLTYNTEYYIGPRQESLILKINEEYKKIFAWPFVFNWILKPIETGTTRLMTYLVDTVGNAGLTLIIIAVLVKLLLLPLSIKSAISMKKMRNLQPKLNKLQEKWGHDPQAIQQKTMLLYKEEKVNPLGGCFPLLLQIPVFFALFRVLSRSVELRGAGFLWMNDLTMPDSLFMIGTFSFNLLPIIMTLLQLVSVFLQQGRMGTAHNEMQKQMQTQSYFMPLIFLFLFWTMPSGLVLYWTIQNVFSIIEQEVINLDTRLANK